MPELAVVLAEDLWVGIGERPDAPLGLGCFRGAGRGVVVGEGVKCVLGGAGLVGVREREEIDDARHGLGGSGASKGHDSLLAILHGDGLMCASPDGEEQRKKFNQWVRTTKDLYGFVDFDVAVRDPAKPSRLSPQYDSGYHLHPNDAGYKAMADSVELSMFR